MAELAELPAAWGDRVRVLLLADTGLAITPTAMGTIGISDEDAKDFDRYVQYYVKPQVRELLTQYGDIRLIWFDTPRRMTGGAIP